MVHFKKLFNIDTSRRDARSSLREEAEIEHVEAKLFKLLAKIEARKVPMDEEHKREIKEEIDFL